MSKSLLAHLATRAEAVLLACILVAGCGGSNETGDPASGRSGPAAIEMLGDTRLLPALVRSGATSATGTAALPRAMPDLAADPNAELRSRGVVLDLSALASANPTAPREPARRGLLRIDFFDDAAAVLQVGSVQTTSSGGTAYVGALRDDPSSLAVLVNNDGAVSLSVVSAEGRYTITGDPTQGYVARQLAPTAPSLHPMEPPVIHAPALETSKRALATALADPPVPDDGSTIDVMVTYTAAARVAFGNGSAAQMNATIDAQIALVNAIYANSNVVQRLRLVYKGEIDVVETDLANDLWRITASWDGDGDSVHDLRNLYRADLVTLWGHYPNTTFSGYASVMGTESSGFEAFAFSAVAALEPSGMLYAHELGHNMGLLHDRFVEPQATTRVTPAGSSTLTDIGYAHGHVDPVNRFFTVMAYPNECANRSVVCRAIPHFSNPAISFDNRAFHAAAVVAPTGTANLADDARALNDTRETVANFRKGLASLTGPGVISFIPTTHSVAEGVGTVRLTVTRHVGSVGAVSVSYATVNGLASAGSDYTATSGTLSWADGDTSPRTITVPIVQDASAEGNEDFLVTLSAPTGGASVGSAGGTTSSAVVTILDDEADAFPLACRPPAGWQTLNASDTPWTGASDQFSAGPCSLKSGTVAGTGQVTSSSLAYVRLQAGTIRFNRRASLRSQSDCLRFSVFGPNGFAESRTVGCIGGDSSRINRDVPWGAEAITIPTAGIYTVTLWFSHTAGSGAAAWIDALRLPMALPGAPGVSSTARGIYGGTAVVGFTPAFDAEFSAITGHSVTCTAPGQTARTGIGTTSPVTVAGLTGGVAYSCAVAAANESGTGTPSTAGPLVTPTRAGLDLSSDFNADGRPDLLWQNTSTGERALWYLNGTSYAGGAGLGVIPTVWEISSRGDFNGDGKPDILWVNTSTGERTIWLMNGSTLLGGASLGVVAVTWQVGATGDFNGDGKTDIVWQNTTTGERAIWFLNGTTYTGGAGLGSIPLAWSIAASGDFNADGKTDLLWQNTTTGERVVWYMDGARNTGGATLTVLPVEWRIAQVADHNGDGRPDVVWENTRTGQRNVWFLNGLALSGGASLGTVPVAWRIVR